jgi:glycosyltransferase involved in cell wall biosynthesis
VLHLHYDGAEAGGEGPIHVRRWMADEVIALSHAVASNVSGLTPRVVYYGIEAFGEPKRRPDLNTLVVGAASRLVPIKGIVYLIRAIARLHDELPAVRLEIAGAGPERQSLEHEAHRLRLRDAVKFVGWQRDIWPWLTRWDVFAQPSLAEGFGMAALEAMTAGLPVVGTLAGGLPELIEDGCTGYVVPPADVTALAARLRALMLDADLRRAMGTAAHARVRQQFSAGRMASDVTAVYDELLGRGGSEAIHVPH